MLGGDGGSAGVLADAAPAFAEGDKVDARYGGKKKWFGGKIKRVLPGAKYDIAYDDGDSESGVKAALIRLSPRQLPAASASPSGFTVGTTIEAKITGCKFNLS